ncbi:hypothetical protein [Methanobrevibacter cuticularis]|nr:hypothetical protein [Methanobrevibacter cuticularis]
MKLIHLIQRRNLSKQRIRHYNLVFKEIHELTAKTPYELIVEAKKEEQPFNDENGNPQILDISERKVSLYQFMYNNFWRIKIIVKVLRKVNYGYFVLFLMNIK